MTPLKHSPPHVLPHRSWFFCVKVWGWKQGYTTKIGARLWDGTWLILYKHASPPRGLIPRHTTRHDGPSKHGLSLLFLLKRLFYFVLFTTSPNSVRLFLERSSHWTVHVEVSLSWLRAFLSPRRSVQRQGRHRFNLSRALVLMSADV